MAITIPTKGVVAREFYEADRSGNSFRASLLQVLELGEFTGGSYFKEDPREQESEGHNLIHIKPVTFTLLSGTSRIPFGYFAGSGSGACSFYTLAQGCHVRFVLSCVTFSRPKDHWLVGWCLGWYAYKHTRSSGSYYHYCKPMTGSVYVWIDEGDFLYSTTVGTHFGTSDVFIRYAQAAMVRANLPYVEYSNVMGKGYRKFSRDELIGFFKRVDLPLDQFNTADDVSDQYSRGYPLDVPPPVLQPTTAMLLLDEDNLIHSGWSSKPFAAYHLKALRQAAYLDALDHVPQLNENSLANALEIISFVKGIVIDHRIEIPRSLQSLWLSYRYVYKTTEMDVKEAAQFVHRHVSEEFLKAGFSCYGTATQTLFDREIVARCSLEMKEKDLDTFNKVWTALYRYGLSPSFYVVWDMVPYSFIVDWFIPIGDILSAYDKTRMYDRTYDITNIWFSIKYEVDDEYGNTYSAYTRWGDSTPPEFNGFYVLENKGTVSDKVVGFRILDSAALLIR